MAGLTVVVDHVAALRDAMQASYPDPVAFALRAESAGADGIGIYLRQDQRPVRERDVRLLRQTLQSRLVLYMAATSELTGLALDIKPERVVLMPALAEDGSAPIGIDMVAESKHHFETIDTLQANGISVGVCVAPQPDQIKMVHQVRANWVQIHTGRLCSSSSAAMQSQELNRIVDCIKMAHRLRLHIAVGHGLDGRLIKLFMGLDEIDEFSLGRSLIAQALLVGIDTAVRDMVGLIRAL